MQSRPGFTFHPTKGFKVKNDERRIGTPKRKNEGR